MSTARKRLFAILLIIAFDCCMVFGQCSNCQNEGSDPLNEFCWGTQPDVVKEHYVFFTDMVKSKWYLESQNALNKQLKNVDWIIDNAPCVGYRFYIYARNFFDDILIMKTSKKKKREFKKLQKKVILSEKKFFCREMEKYGDIRISS